jgi:hypothetical protein
MGRFEDFAATLEKKIRREIENEMREGFSEGKCGPELAFGTDELAIGFAWMMGQPFSRSETVPVSKGRSAYGVRPRPPRPHTLSERQSLAKELFGRWGAVLSPAFRPAELKSAWRRVAKAVHPDHGGNAEAFREALEAYHVLKTVFKG